MEELGEHTVVILKEMCKRVGVDYDKVNFSDPRWYQKHTWTVEMEKEFEKWMIDYLYNHKAARNELMTITAKKKKNAAEATQMWTFQYGWSYPKELT